MTEHVASSAGQVCCDDEWERAYARFETPDQEIAKFQRRLRAIGAEAWPRHANIVDLFCGRGNGLHALSRLGFTSLAGADLSPALVAMYDGPAEMRVCDCRATPYADASKDVAIVQGGLHHLPTLPDDLELAVADVRRILRPSGLFVVVEPWSTPFLRTVHAVGRLPMARAAWGRLDALMTMIEHERTTYDRWLASGPMVLEILHRYFAPVRESMSWGKLVFVGAKRSEPA